MYHDVSECTQDVSVRLEVKATHGVQALACSCPMAARGKLKLELKPLRSDFRDRRREGDSDHL